MCAHTWRLEHVALRSLEERVVQLGGQIVGLQVERHALRAATPRTERRVIRRRDAEALKTIASTTTTRKYSYNYASSETYRRVDAAQPLESDALHPRHADRVHLGVEW